MKLPRSLLFLLICFCIGSCTDNNQKNDLQRWMTTEKKLKVLSTIEMINNLVERIGEDHIVTLTLIRGDLDPHSYQLVKGDDEKLNQAHVIFYNGLGLEHGPSLQRYLQQNPHAKALGNEIQKQYPQEIIHYQGQLDPHIWMDISVWQKTVPVIVETLSAKDPEHAKSYHENGQKLLEEMKKADAEVKEMFKNVPENKRYLVTSHDAFNYFTRAYLATDEERKSGEWQKRVAAPEGLAPESQLSTNDIQTIIEHLKQHDIHILFPESNVSKDSIRKIVSAGKEKGLKLNISDEALYADAMGRPGTDGDSYLKMIKHDAQVIVNGLTFSSEKLSPN